MFWGLSFFPETSLGDSFVFSGVYYYGDGGYALPMPTTTAWLFDQSVYPNGVTLTRLSGAFTDIDEDPSSPDGNWLLVN